jgi:hypothetical protein
MTQMKNANITAAPQLLSLPEFNFDYFSCSLTSKMTTIWSKGKDNTTVKRKRQHYGQKKKATLWSKEKDKQRSTNHTHKTND